MYPELYNAQEHEVDAEPVPTYAETIGMLRHANTHRIVQNVHPLFSHRIAGVPTNGTINGAAHNGHAGCNGHAPQTPDYQPLMHTDENGPAFDALRELGLE